MIDPPPLSRMCGKHSCINCNDPRNADCMSIMMFSSILGSSIGKKFVKELEECFVNYHDLQGEKYRILDVKGPAEAHRRIADGMKNVRKRKSDDLEFPVDDFFPVQGKERIVASPPRIFPKRKCF